MRWRGAPAILTLLMLIMLLTIGCIATPDIDQTQLKKAQEGHAHSQFAVGERYRDAYYASFNISSLNSAFYLWEEAAGWYEKAANQGHAGAQSRLSNFYFTFRSDYNRSFFWVQKAAVQNIAEAQYSLGMHYFQAWGTTQDLVLAYKWTLLAFEGNIPNPIGKLADPEWIARRGKITPSQIAEAQRLAAEHTARYGKSRPIELTR